VIFRRFGLKIIISLVFKKIANVVAEKWSRSPINKDHYMGPRRDKISSVLFVLRDFCPSPKRQTTKCQNSNCRLDNLE
jgi:hypothetical protein